MKITAIYISLFHKMKNGSHEIALIFILILKINFYKVFCLFHELQLWYEQKIDVWKLWAMVCEQVTPMVFEVNKMKSHYKSKFYRDKGHNLHF